MTTQNPCALAPVVSIVHNAVTALSTDVARSFGKLHKNVLRDIRSLIEQAPQLSRLNFEPAEIVDAQGKKRPAYRMDRKGFVLLAMGFTGEVALKFKIAYIDKFDYMEEQLRKQQYLAENNLATLTPAQQHQIQIAVAARAQKTAHNYQTIYRALKNRYQVARYDQIPQSQFQDALRFIQSVDLSVPETSESTGEIFYYNARTLSEHELRALANLIYLRELGKPTFSQVYKGLRSLNSELAPRFYSLIAEGDFPVAALKEVLSRNKLDFTRPIR